MASLRKRGRVWYYRYTDEYGIKREEKGCTDRQVTQELARDSESRVCRIKAGQIDPKAERILTDGRREISEHVDDFISSLRMAGRNPQHIAQTERYPMFGVARRKSLAGNDRFWGLSLRDGFLACRR